MRYGRVLLAVLVVFFCCALEGRGRKKKHPIWNLEKCIQVSLSELSLSNPKIYEYEGKKLAVWARFKGSDGTTLEVEGSGVIPFLLKSPSARRAALQKDLKNLLIFGKIDLSQGLRFLVYHLERAPSFWEIFRERFESLDKKKEDASSDEWLRLAQWALEKGEEDKDKRLIKGAFFCYFKAIEIMESFLDPNNPSQVDEYVKLIQLSKKVNSIFHAKGYPDLQIPRDKIFKLVQVVLKYQPARLDIRNVLFELHYYPYKGRYRPYEEFKHMEGFRKYKGPIKKYNGKWVDPVMYRLLKAAENRLEVFTTLRLPPERYEKALQNRSLLQGMSRQEIVSVAGFPRLVFRLTIKKFDREAGIEMPTSYEIWVYGEKKDEYLCLESGTLFYFPPTFAPHPKR